MGLDSGTDEALVGRGNVTELLTRSLDDALLSRPRLVLIEGEAGIGKSRVLAWVRALCAARGVAVAVGSAQELERQQRPLGPLLDALRMETTDPDEAQKEVLRLLQVRGTDQDPSLAGADVLLPSPNTRFQLLSALVRFIERKAAAGPLALVLDDLQWTDSDTAEVLHRLFQRPGPWPVLIVCAFRPSPRMRELAALPAAAPPGSVDEVRLGPLDQDAVHELIEVTARARPGSGLIRAVAGAGGNPFFVRELVAALKDDGRITIHDGVADVSNPGLPPSIRTTVIRRMAGLHDDTQRGLRWASILGSSFTIADLSAVTGATLPDTIDVLQPALDASFLRDAGTRLAFRHDLVREAIYADMPEAMRAARHLHVGRVLAGGGAGALEVAPHFARGARGNEREAAGWLKRAADDVELRSPATAVGLLEQATDLLPAHDELRSAALFSLVRALLWSGAWGQAHEVARRALDRDEGAGIEGALRYVMARALVYQGRTADSVEEAGRALKYPLPGRDRARLLADMSMRLPLMGKLEEGEASARQALRLADENEDSLAARTAWSGLSLIDVLRGRPRRAIQLAETALPRGDGSVSESVEFVQPHFFYAIALGAADEYDRAHDVLSRLRTRTEEIGMTWARGLADGLVADLEFKRGNWAEAVDAAKAWQAAMAETGTRVWLVLVQCALIRIAIHRGDLPEAARLSESVEALIVETGNTHLGIEHWWHARAIHRAALNDEAAALQALREGWQMCENSGLIAGQREIGPDLARLSSRAGLHDRARLIADSLMSAATAAESPSYTAAAARADGWAGAVPETLLGAAAAYEQAGRPLESATSLEDAGTLLAESGDRKRAVDALQRALAGYERLGADHHSARIISMLRSLGVIRGVRRPRSRPDTGWAALTRTECDVARLAAEGLTNPEIGARMFISKRTVATHLAHIFAKLGLSSRVELATAAARERRQ